MPECQGMGFFVFRLPALVSNKIRLQPSDEEAVPRGGRGFLETDKGKLPGVTL